MNCFIYGRLSSLIFLGFVKTKKSCRDGAQDLGCRAQDLGCMAEGLCAFMNCFIDGRLASLIFSGVVQTGKSCSDAAEGSKGAGFKIQGARLKVQGLRFMRAYELLNLWQVVLVDLFGSRSNMKVLPRCGSGYQGCRVQDLGRRV